MNKPISIFANELRSGDTFCYLSQEYYVSAITSANGWVHFEAFKRRDPTNLFRFSYEATDKIRVLPQRGEVSAVNEQEVLQKLQTVAPERIRKTTIPSTFGFYVPERSERIGYVKYIGQTASGIRVEVESLLHRKLPPTVLELNWDDINNGAMLEIIRKHIDIDPVLIIPSTDLETANKMVRLGYKIVGTPVVNNQLLLVLQYSEDV